MIMGAVVLSQSISLFLPALTETPGRESIPIFGTSKNAGPLWHLLPKWMIAFFKSVQ